MLKNLQQQNFHPQVILGSASYSNDLVSASGGPAAVDGALFDQNTSLFLGQDAPQIPAVGLFNKWVQKASPGFKTDLFTLYGWLSAELFSQALKNAGSNPEPGLPPAGAVQDHLVQRGQHHRSEQSGGQDRGKLLPARRGGQRPVPADQRPGRRQQHQRLPV